MAILTDKERSAIWAVLYWDYVHWPRDAMDTVQQLLDRDQKCRDQLEARRKACADGTRDEGFGALE